MGKMAATLKEQCHNYIIKHPVCVNIFGFFFGTRFEAESTLFTCLEVRVQVNICFSLLQVWTGVSLQILQLRFGEEIQVRSIQGLSRGDPQGL